MSPGGLGHLVSLRTRKPYSSGSAIRHFTLLQLSSQHCGFLPSWLQMLPLALGGLASLGEDNTLPAQPPPCPGQLVPTLGREIQIMMESRWSTLCLLNFGNLIKKFLMPNIVRPLMNHKVPEVYYVCRPHPCQHFSSPPSPVDTETTKFARALERRCC